MARLRHRFAPRRGEDLAPACVRCGVQRLVSKKTTIAEFRFGDGPWSTDEPACRDPRQSDMFAADLSLPEGFEEDERAEREERIAIVDEAYLPPPEHAVSKTAWWEDRPVRTLDLPAIFPGSCVLSERVLGEHEALASNEVSLAFDPEGRHLGRLRKWDVRPFAERPLVRGMERVFRGTRVMAEGVVETMKGKLRMRPDAWIVMTDGEIEVTYRRNGKTWNREEKSIGHRPPEAPAEATSER